MSTAGRPDEPAPAASDIAGRLRDAGLVRLVAAATGDGVAAASLLARTLEASGTAHQLSVVAVPERAACATDADVTVALGRPVADADVTLGTDVQTASEAVLPVARELGRVDYELALAGVLTASRPDSALLAAAEEHGIEARPGIGIPTADRADGLAHSGLVHAPFSGSLERADEALEALGTADDAEAFDQRVASMVALAVCGDGANEPGAAVAVERFLRPLAAPGGRFETVEGYADVLAATAHERPGSAVALAFGALEPAAALECWRAHTQAVHRAIRESSTHRYDGLFVVQCRGRGPLEPVARLVGAYRSPEPLVLAVGERAVAARATGADCGHVGSLVAEAAVDCGGEGAGTATRGRATDVDPTAFVGRFREALR